ncbi:hypothetical protein CDV36_014548 [Fusarium kuroshium]|uniref:Zn(2)-C6 fungal-type domain-containing protein n=1 Tax=Fusarium kuroshium TaxID=2010991 RepID=A0A3M2RHP6_9HYPO|nr:hypothetical protein CDV36_014548 [Fusarium kuroshium]
MSSSQVTPPPAASTRKPRSKVKSGCKTCKVRKVKCDEGRPACRRCLSTGRVCDGYGIWGGGNARYPQRQGGLFESKAKDGRVPIYPVSISRPVQPSLALTLNPQQKIYFDWFKCRTASKLPGTFTSSFWNTLVFQAGSSEPAVLNAILALSSVHKGDAIGVGLQKSRQDALRNEQEQFTLQHYVKAISHLQPHFSTKDRASCRIALIACIVFVCMEFLRGHFKTAQLHLANGIEILGHLQGQSDPKSGILTLKPCHDPTDDWVIEAFSRLHIQVELFRHLYQHPCVILQPAFDPQRTPTSHIRSLSDAWKQMEPILNNIFHLTQQARQHPVTTREHTSQQLIKAKLAQWLNMFEAFNKVQPCEESGDLEKAYQVVRVNHTMATIMADTCLHTDESIYDAYTDRFLLLITQLTRLWVVSAETEDFSLNWDLMYMPRSIIDIGWIAPLYFTAVKCRIHRIRLQAIKLLPCSGHREGIWDSSIAACVARKVMEMEEGDFYQGLDLGDDFAMDTLPRPQDLALPLIPESRRLNEVELELSGAPMDRMLLFCKQRQHGVRRRVLVSQYSVLLQLWVDT